MKEEIEWRFQIIKGNMRKDENIMGECFGERVGERKFRSRIKRRETKIRGEGDFPGWKIEDTIMCWTIV